LREQYLIFDDEAALIANSQQSLRDLERLFQADEGREAERAPEQK